MGAVPKKKITTHRQGKRRASIKVEKKNLIVCSNCGNKKLPHVACKECGYYKNEPVK